MQQLADAGIGVCPTSGMPVLDPSACAPGLRTAIWGSHGTARWLPGTVDAKGRWPSAAPKSDPIIVGRRASMEAALWPVGHRHAQPENHGTSLSAAAATLATTSFHMVEHA